MVPTNAMYSDDCKHTANVSVDFSEERALQSFSPKRGNVVNHYRSYLSLLLAVKYDYYIATVSSVLFAFK